MRNLLFTKGKKTIKLKKLNLVDAENGIKSDQCRDGIISSFFLSQIIWNVIFSLQHGGE